jgi:glucosamine-6-phosphate deaminase
MTEHPLGRLDVALTPAEAGARAAAFGAARIRTALEAHGAANIVVATGRSQFGVFDGLVSAEVDWRRVTAFHLDEYVGLPADHPASFRHYLETRFVRRLPVPLRAFFGLDGEADPETECRRIGRILAEHPVDVAFVGIGENGHLAFNDPPADFAAAAPFLVVTLDDACRRQQVGEGWFANLADVPTRALTMSIRQILESRTIVCTAPERRKATAVRRTLTGPVTPDVPASILRTHGDVVFFLDRDSAPAIGNEP